MVAETPRFTDGRGSAEDLFAKRVRAIYPDALVVLVSPALNAALLVAFPGSVTLAGLDPAVPPEARERLEEAERVSIRARGLTRQLLTFSKGDTPRREPLDPGELVRRAVRLAMSGRGDRMEVSIASDLRTIRADPGQIAQVLHDLTAKPLRLEELDAVLRRVLSVR